jgi:hypothetical protein
MMIASRRARATLAFRIVDRLAIAKAQSLGIVNLSERRAEERRFF